MEIKQLAVSHSHETDSSTDETDDDNDEFQDTYFHCKSKYPPTKKEMKSIDWLKCDACDHWFHEFYVSRDESGDLFTCTDCF